MASLPARQPSQRRSSPSEQQSQPPQSAPVSSQSPARSRSEDSQTIFVSKPEEDQSDQQEDALTTPSMQATAGSNSEDDTSKRCWICMSDSTEDTPETSPWRNPCPCALVAHEECLLDWIADMEAPKSTRSTGIAAPEIKCPQCKSDITIARPRDYLVDAVRAIERIGARQVLPASGIGLITAIANVSMSVGVHSIYAVFGAEDGFRILRPITFNAIRAPLEVYAGNPGEASRQLTRLLQDRIVHWRLYLGVPRIMPILVLSRTSLADEVLPFLPIVLFASQAHTPGEALDLLQWPPSASFSFAILPYVRALYNAYYKAVWAEKEKQWIKEVQPRASAEGGGEGAEQAQQGQFEQEEAENVFEVRIDGGIWDDGDEVEEEEAEEERLVQEAADAIRIRDAPDGEAPLPVDRPAEDIQAGADAAPPPVVQDNRERGRDQQPQQNAEQPQNAPPIPNQNEQANVERRLSFSPTGIAETVLGALFFPTIAGLSGEALKLVLPTSWVVPLPTEADKAFRFVTRPKGFLQSKWARSLVGGCLFVVFKDALLLYAKWKTAQMHRRRRVVDHDRSKTASTRG